VEIIAEERFAHPAVDVVPTPFTILVMNVADPKIGTHQHIDLVYVCRPYSTEVVHQPDEVSGCRWVPLADVASLDTPPELPTLIAAAAKYLRAAS